MQYCILPSVYVIHPRIALLRHLWWLPTTVVVSNSPPGSGVEIGQRAKAINAHQPTKVSSMYLSSYFKPVSVERAIVYLEGRYGVLACVEEV